ncbi:MAG TPA: hypothetical protein VEK08_26585 [Planctomycetota bacterium]|nr:hypothetical protein [Planctomycetota bacterium]
MSVCVNHPNIQAEARCACCHKPVCGACVLRQGSSTFCSEKCIENAARFNASFRPDRGPGFFGTIKNMIVSLVGLAAVLAIIAVLCAKVLNIPFFVNLLKKFGL